MWYVNGCKIQIHAHYDMRWATRNATQRAGITALVLVKWDNEWEREKLARNKSVRQRHVVASVRREDLYVCRCTLPRDLEDYGTRKVPGQSAHGPRDEYLPVLPCLPSSSRAVLLAEAA